MVDDDWFDGFYDRALPVVYGYFLRRCGGSRDIAEELTQDTFMSALKTLDRGAKVEAEMPWIVAIARRRLVDHYRHESRSRRDPVTQEPRDDAQTATSETEARLITALNGVPHDQRLVLILRHVDDLPVDQVAAMVGRSTSATESLLRRARASLLRAYEDVEID